MGEYAISRTEWGVSGHSGHSGRTTPRRSAPSVVSTGVLTGFVLAFFAAALAAAAPAAAVDDPTRPDARVTHGPSCQPGGLVVEVQAGSTPYSVRLATTRDPAGEDEADLAPGQAVVLRSGDVAWGETIDGRLEYTAQDGSGYVDELEDYSFTRPSQEDCAAITAPASPEPTGATPTAGTSAAAAGTSAGGEPGSPAPSAPEQQGSQLPPPPADGGRPGTGAPGSTAASTASADRVTAGSLVVLRATGFRPGERVTVLLHAGGLVLGSAVAGDDGTLEAEVRIPSGTSLGAARIDLVGDESAVVTNLDLQVAAAESGTTPHRTTQLWSLGAAAAALVASVGGLVSVAGRTRAIRGSVFSSGRA